MSILLSREEVERDLSNAHIFTPKVWNMFAKLGRTALAYHDCREMLTQVLEELEYIKAYGKTPERREFRRVLVKSARKFLEERS